MTEKCLPDEEEFLGLCYKKCSLLTDNVYKVRCFPNTCAVSHCDDWPWNIKVSGMASLCNGFGVSSDGGCATVIYHPWLSPDHAFAADGGLAKPLYHLWT